MVTAHRHVHANINQYMSDAKIREDVRQVLGMDGDTTNINEAVTATLVEIRRIAAKDDLGVFSGPRGLRQLVTIWDQYKYAKVATWGKIAAKGVRNLSPDRGNISVGLRRKVSGASVSVVNAHKDSKAFTTNDRLTKLRRARWNLEYAASVARVRYLVARRDVVIFSEDANRPLSEWPGRQPYPTLTTSKWAKRQKTAKWVRTGATYGKLTYDYVLVFSKAKQIRIIGARAVNLNSDHRAVVVDMQWD